MSYKEKKLIDSTDRNKYKKKGYKVGKSFRKKIQTGRFIIVAYAYK